ncbi:MAG: PilT/PilU family type 4a pilus ATPase [Pseudohongiellaceae bacterium]
MDIHNYLEIMAEKNASDLFFSVGAPITIKVEGSIYPLDNEKLQHESVQKLVYGIISDEQRSQFEKSMELNFSYELPNIGRYRINLYRQRGEVSMVIRYIKSTIPSMEDLHLPEILKSLTMESRGLVLIVGATGSGKSTTLASMLDYHNAQKASHILTIEDPIEYIFSNKKSVVEQREVGIDTLSFSNALKNAMREAPDIIMIGEIRDQETMQQAISYAETGHLCLSTLHSSNANETINRIANFLPESGQAQLLSELALNLKAIVCQKLLRGTDGNLVPVFEILLKSAYVSHLIETRKIDKLKQAIENGRELGMQTFDQTLYDLYEQNKITKDVALQNADSKVNLSVKIKLQSEPKSNKIITNK